MDTAIAYPVRYPSQVEVFFHLKYLQFWRKSGSRAMAVGKTTWKAFLVLVASHCEIEGEPKNVFMNRFEACDPAVSGCQPTKLKRGDPDYGNHQKHLTVVYKKLEINAKIKFPSPRKTDHTLNWLWQEYKNPTVIVWESIKLHNHAEKLDVFLRNFNYCIQRRQVEDAIYGSEIFKVILVRVDGDFTKRWLVKRLALEVPNHDQSIGFSLPAQPKWNNQKEEKGLTFFWESISRYAQTASPEPIDVIQELRNRCVDKPLIMAIHGIQMLEAETLQKILSVFWEPLINKIASQSWSGDCILFLTTDLNKHSSIKSTNPLYGVDLKPWDFVTRGEMHQFLKCNELRQMIHDCSNEIKYLLPSETNKTKTSDSLGSPQEMLTKICTAVDLNGCADLESYWKIAL
jgi:inactive STAND